MSEIQYLSINKNREAKKRQLLNLPKIHINHTYMKSTSNVGKLSFAEINSNKSLESLKGEIWKDVNSHKGHYQISNLGRLKSLDKKIICSYDHAEIRYKGRVLSLRKNNSNYVVYSLSKGKSAKGKHGTVHRLVADAFIPNPENKPCVNHIDGNKENNSMHNLEWVTYSENCIHARETGLINQRGENNSSSKFTRKQIEIIRCRIADGEKNIDIANEFGVAESTVSRIKNNAVYK